MAMSPVTIRGLEPGDIPTILELARSLDEWFNEEGLGRMGRDLAVHAGLVAIDSDRLVGFATWQRVDPRTADLSWIGVTKDRHRRGIGRALVRGVVQRLLADGVRFLDVSTVADSLDYEPYARTRNFYRRLGFRSHRVDPLFYGHGGDRYDRLVLRLSLESAVWAAP